MEKLYYKHCNQFPYTVKPLLSPTQQACHCPTARPNCIVQTKLGPRDIITVIPPNSEHFWQFRERPLFKGFTVIISRGPSFVCTTQLGLAVGHSLIESFCIIYYYYDTDTTTWYNLIYYTKRNRFRREFYLICASRNRYYYYYHKRVGARFSPTKILQFGCSIVTIIAKFQIN